jgi:hypothetical protein
MSILPKGSTVFVEKRRERLHSGECRRTRKPVAPWVMGIGFYSLFALPEGRDVSQVQTEVSWEGAVSSSPLISFWDLLQSVLQYWGLNSRPYVYQTGTTPIEPLHQPITYQS